MRRRTPRLMIVASLLVLAGCATLRPDFEAPTVTVSSIRALPAESMAPQFEIGLHIVNPNRAALELHGLAYRLNLQGYNILTGVAKDLPTIDGYGEGDITLIATTDMLSSIRWLANLMSTQSEVIAYELEAKLDLGGFHPTIRVKKEGEINLSGLAR
jgi:LEA14-like dessication related protein